MTLAFTKANSVLTAVDSETNNTYLFTGVCTVQMNYQSTTAAQYYLYNGHCSLTFKLSEISTIGGSPADSNPVTALGQLKALLPLYA